MIRHGLGGGRQIGYGLGDVRTGAAAVVPSWWEVTGKTCVAAYQPKGAPSQAASYVNLANPGTYDATSGDAPAWDAGIGWEFGSNRYLTTGITSFPTAGTWLVRCTDGPGDGTTAASPLGFYSLDPSARFLYVLLNYYGKQMWANTNSSGKDIGSVLTGGVFGVADRTAYQNGSSVGTLSAAGAVVTDRYIYLGAAQHPFSGLSYSFPGKIQAAVFYSDTLDGTQFGTVSAAMAAL